jgi:putative GTP pyrophosphokinase
MPMMSSLSKLKILADFDKSNGTYLDFSKNVSDLIEKILVASGISVHSVTWRCKERESFARKLSRVDKQYQGIGDVTDLAAMRITTHFSDDVDRVAKIIEGEFEIDRVNSVDKRIALDPDRFGYQSMHYVVGLSGARKALVENQRFSDLKIEIQIRSILQHAWAEIEHDMGYKSASGIPRDVKRRFARVAGLLELADAEFESIRMSLQAYAGAVVAEIQEDPTSVELDLVSLRALHTIDSACKNLDKLVALKMGCQLVYGPDDISASYVDWLMKFGITNIDELEAIAAAEKEVIDKFAAYWLSRPNEDCEDIGKPAKETIRSGIGLFYLLYILLWKAKDFKVAHEYFESNSIGMTHNRAQTVQDLMTFEL